MIGGPWLFVSLLFLTPVLAVEDEAWAIHAHADLSTSNAEGLQERAPMNLEDLPAERKLRAWTWYVEEETGSSWPDDDALYRASNRNVSSTQTQQTPWLKRTSVR